MLEDVGDAGRVLWNGWKAHRKPVVVIVALDVDVLGPGSLVYELDERALQPLQRLPPDDRITADRLHAARADACQSY